VPDHFGRLPPTYSRFGTFFAPTARQDITEGQAGAAEVRHLIPASYRELRALRRKSNCIARNALPSAFAAKPPAVRSGQAAQGNSTNAL